MDHSPLGRLPPELRLRIYELVLPRGEVFNMIILFRKGRDYLYARSEMGQSSALTSTCKTIHAESIDILYSDNSFMFEMFETKTCATRLDRFRKQIGPHNTEAMRTVHVELVDVDGYDVSQVNSEIIALQKQQSLMPACTLELGFAVWVPGAGGGLCEFQLGVKSKQAFAESLKRSLDLAEARLAECYDYRSRDRIEAIRGELGRITASFD